MTEANIVRELVYDNSGKLSETITTTQPSTGQAFSSSTHYSYDAQGKLTESTTSTDWRLVYFYNGNLITATDEYVTGVLSQQHHFTYDQQGKLVTKLTTQDIPEEGGIIPVSREDYQYDDRGNLTVLELFYYTTGGAESKLLTRFVFSNYDDKISSDEYFHLNAYNPLLSVRKNNPGKLEITNSSGVLTITDVYTYEYHSRGYATRKTTNSTFHNGESATSVVDYEFE